MTRTMRPHVTARTDRAAVWRERIRRGEVERLVQVPVGPFRERFVHMRGRGEITLGQLCREMGWTYLISEDQARRERRRSCIKPNTSLAERRLGLRAHSCSGFEREHVPYEMAERLCQVLGMDPHEAGI